MAAKLTASISSVKNCISRYAAEGNTRNIHGWTKKKPETLPTLFKS